MARSPKLNDLQIILLSTAAQRDDGRLMPPPEQIANQVERIHRAIPPLIKRALVLEVEVAHVTRSWRSDGERHFGLVITDAGRTIIEVDISEPEEPEDTKPAPADVTSYAAPRADTKIASVVQLLKRDMGATLSELVAATGWLPHTTRAALTGLRKKGHAIARTSRDGATVYSIAA